MLATVTEMTGDTDDGLVGCYPGTFDPPTIAHLAVAEAAMAHAGLVRLDLVVSRVPLGKEAVDPAALDQRVAALEAVAATRPWLGVVMTDANLIADIARGYDAVVMGADKWRQVCDPSWYRSPAAWDEAVAALPRVLVAARGDDALDDNGATQWPFERLDIDETHLSVSSTAIRNGDPRAGDWLLLEADPRPSP